MTPFNCSDSTTGSLRDYEGTAILSGGNDAHINGSDSTALVDADRPLAVGMTPFTTVPRDATRAGAISTPIELAMA